LGSGPRLEVRGSGCEDVGLEDGFANHMIRVNESQAGLAKGDDDVDFIGLRILKEFLHNGVRFPLYITGIEMTPLLKPGAARGREKKRVGEWGEFTGAHVCATLNPSWEDFTVTTGSQSMRFSLRMIAKLSPSQSVVWQM
jgi:hypothetical protein